MLCVHVLYHVFVFILICIQKRINFKVGIYKQCWSSYFWGGGGDFPVHLNIGDKNIGYKISTRDKDAHFQMFLIKLNGSHEHL